MLTGSVYLLQADKAISERIKVLALSRIVYGSNHWKLAEAHVKLAEDYLELKGQDWFIYVSSLFNFSEFKHIIHGKLRKGHSSI